MKVNSPREMLLAVAQVIEDYPERHAKYQIAYDNNGLPAHPASSTAQRFCAEGMMVRIDAEQKTCFAPDALELFKMHTFWSLSNASDRIERPALIKQLREVANQL